MPPGYGQLLYPPPPSQPLYPPPPGYGQPGAYPPPAPPSQPLYPPPMGYAPPLYPAQQDPRGAEAIAGLILGTISIPAVLLGSCGLAFGILGLVFSIRGRASYTRRSLATAGLVCSCIGLGLMTLKVAAFVWSILGALPH